MILTDHSETLEFVSFFFSMNIKRKPSVTSSEKDTKQIFCLEKNLKLGSRKKKIYGQLGSRFLNIKKFQINPSD